MRIAPIAAACLALAAVPAPAQMPPSAEARMEAQRAAMARLSAMDGVWRGPAWTLTPEGRRELVQTERVGPFLGGTVRILEGRGFEADGSVGFNALGVISFEPSTGRYMITSWAVGHNLSVPLSLTDTGYVWETPAGPGAIIRYTATIRDGVWREVGERIAGEAPPVRVVELNLRRVGDAAWPAGDPVPLW